MIVLLCLFLPLLPPQSLSCTYKPSVHTSPYTYERNCMSTGTARQYKKLCRPPLCAVLIGQFIPAGGCLSMQLRPALPGTDQVHHMSWSKMVLILVIFHLQKSGKLMPKEVRCMARCLGHAADAILCREIFKPQSMMFQWR